MFDELIALALRLYVKKQSFLIKKFPTKYIAVSIYFVAIRSFYIEGNSTFALYYFNVGLYYSLSARKTFKCIHFDFFSSTFKSDQVHFVLTTHV